ncbi:unnamed protein product [Brachionus calyciflorus]|uniref:Uncharacterized protein n=1 Tax=Brachionus calyciflorus TaxID=104777 RepID=A0A813NAW8_9BILA|nr:unnamed protein product [Brachionus calyciflorus]
MVLKLGFFIFIIVKLSECYFHEIEYDEISTNKNLTILKDIKILLPTNYASKRFPDNFNLTFTFNGTFHFKVFKLTDAKIGDTKLKNSYDIYVIDKQTSQPIKYQDELEISGENYSLTNGEGLSRLIPNNNTKNPFRLLATIYSNVDPSLTLDILPSLTVPRRKKRNFPNELKLFDSETYQHIIRERPISHSYYFDNNMKSLRKTKIARRQKRSVNGQPILLNVELLLVTDSSVYTNFQRLIASTNSQIVFSAMRHYYAHLINGVNQRYQVSLENDPDLRINIIMTNFLFLTDPNDQQCLSVQSSGDLNFPIYKGKETLVIDKTFKNFADYMNSKTFPFEYDHAAGLFNKEIVSNDFSTPIEFRSGTAGYCPGIVCTDQRYSINEDFGGFSNLLIIAHEIAHSSGSVHDGFGVASSCPYSQKFIMSPSLSAGSLNRFSSCSINQFKTLLLNQTLSGVSQIAQCAADGTLCDSGKVWQLGKCLPSPNAKTGSCLFGDGLIIQDVTGLELISPQMKCTDFFDLIISKNQSVSGYCADELIGQICCQSCKRFTGELCEHKITNGCFENPCKNGGTCQSFGTHGYICLCPAECRGYNCTECQKSSSVATKISIPLPIETTTTTAYMKTDFDSTKCAYYKTLGLCDQDAYIGFVPIKEACPITCDQILITTTKKTSDCFDLYPQQCLAWKNFCDLLNGLPEHPCKQSCFICK